MNRRNFWILPLALVTVLLCAGVSGAGKETMHPVFSTLDAAGQPTPDAERVSTEKTCGACHDTTFIRAHNNHYNDTVKADCAVCHFKGGRFGDDLKHANELIRQPGNENCSNCHQIIHEGQAPLSIPDDFRSRFTYVPGRKDYAYTQRTGAIFSSQDLSKSAMNLADKSELNFPWDVHARRQLNCVSCHFVHNELRNCGEKTPELSHLKRDPRRLKSVADYLKYPNHELKGPDCRCCHDAMAVHDHLPFKRRHMDVLGCQACHVSRLDGPAFKAVDKTTVTAGGDPLVELRGTDAGSGDNLNTSLLEGYEPFLFPRERDLAGGPGEPLTPHNLVTTWLWVSAGDGQTVADDLVRQVFLDGTGYRQEVLSRFDENRDGTLSPAELVLSSRDKIDFIRRELEQLGVKDPEIRGVIKAFPVLHGVSEKKTAMRTCTDCHDSVSRLEMAVPLASHPPTGVLPEFVDGGGSAWHGEIEKGPGGGLFLVPPSSASSLYVLGHTRNVTLRDIGIIIFFLNLLGVFIHAAWRVHKRGQPHGPHEEQVRTVYMYGFYERFWHWTMVVAILCLLWTGIEIHWADGPHLIGFELAVSVHNIIGILMAVNGFMAFFYYVATGEIRKFYRVNRTFLQDAILQIFYYTVGIFRRCPHPLKKTMEYKYNPLQQVTYVILLNVVIPFQIITGILIIGASWWPAFSRVISGLTWVAALHNLGSWIILSFLVMHVYMTTTGHTVFSNIKGMLTGYEELDEEEELEERRALRNMRVLDLTRTLIGRISDKPVKKGE